MRTAAGRRAVGAVLMTGPAEVVGSGGRYGPNPTRPEVAGVWWKGVREVRTADGERVLRCHRRENWPWENGQRVVRWEYPRYTSGE